MGPRSLAQVDRVTVALNAESGVSPAWDSLAREFNNLYGLVDLPATVTSFSASRMGRRSSALPGSTCV